MGDFPSQIQTQPSIGVEGAFAAHNPRFNFLAGPGGLVADVNGCLVGRFAWVTYPPDSDGTPSLASNSGFGPVAGFVHNEQQGLITVYLEAASLMIPAGFPVSIETGGDFFAKNAGATQAQNGMKAFASVLDGSVSFAAAGTIPGGASDSTGGVVNTTLTLTASVSGDVMTVTAVSAGKPYPGVTLTSNAVGQVVKQLTNATGPITIANPANYDVGTYLLTVGEQDVASTTIGGNYGLYTISGGTIVGNFAVGTVLSGTGLTVGTVITYQASGASGHAVGATFVTNNYSTATSTPITGSTSVETKWYARSTGLTGEVVKISSQPLG